MEVDADSRDLQKTLAALLEGDITDASYEPEWATATDYEIVRVMDAGTGEQWLDERIIHEINEPFGS